MSSDLEKADKAQVQGQAYQAGIELARRMGRQSRTERRHVSKRTVHVVSADEYVLTEETTDEEITSFGNDIFKY